MWKIADFGITREIGKSNGLVSLGEGDEHDGAERNENTNVLSNPLMTPGNHVVSLWYRAPEQIFNCSYYSYSADMWSIGIIIRLLSK